MTTAWIISFKLKEDVTKEDFISATKQLHDEIISKANGFIFWKQYLQEDTWIDFVLWESLEDAKKATTIGRGKAVTKHFYSLIQLKTCQMHIAPLVQEYEVENKQ